MSYLSEQMQTTTPLADALSSGLDAIRYNQTITATAYVRVVLPLDGYVFWVNYSLISNEMFESLNIPTISNPTISAPASIHVTTRSQQDLDTSFDNSDIVITTTEEIRPFHDVGTNVLWLMDVNGVRCAIGSRTSFYQQANLYHYKAATIEPVLLSQIIDTLDDFSINDNILTNSTSLWMTLSSLANSMPWLPGFNFPLYPNYLVEDNINPPYGVIHVLSGSQTPVSAPRYDAQYDRYGYVRETVDIICYGLDNTAILNFVDTALGYALGFNYFGINNIPVVIDEYHQQNELSALAEKKRVSFEINYYQTVSRDIAIKYILKCVPTLITQFNPT